MADKKKKHGKASGSSAKRSTGAPVDTKPQKTRKECGSLIPLAVLAAALVIETFVIFPNSTGIVGKAVHGLLYGLLGAVGAFALPLAMAAIAFFYKTLYKNGVSGRKALLALISILSLSAAIQLIAVGIPQASSEGSIIAILWTDGRAGKGGGAVGGMLAKLLGLLFGKTGGVISALAICLITLSFTLGYTGIGIWRFIIRILCLDAPEEPRRSSEDAKKSRRRKTDTSQKAPTADKVDVSKIRAADISADIGEPSRGALADSISACTRVPDDIVAEGAESGADSTQAFANAESDDDLSTVVNTFITTDDEPDGDMYGSDDADELSNTAGSTDDISDDISDDDDDDDDADELEFTAGEYSTVHRVSSTLPPEPQKDDGIKRWHRGDKYAYPSTELLNPIEQQSSMSEEQIQKVADKLLRKLASFRVNAKLVGYSVGPSITRYELAPGEGVRVKAISQLLDDISLELAADGVRIEHHIPGKSAVGVEVPNQKVSIVPFRMLVEDPSFKKAKSKITVCIGLNVTGSPVFMDIDDMPHVLIAGQTKSGKSVAINCMLLSLLFRVSPDEVKLILIDPKRVELNIYGKIPHLVMPVVDEPGRAAAALSWAVKEMERRYDLMEKYSARSRDEYRKKTASDPDREDFPQIIIIVDELADLMLQVREHVEPLINRLAAKARACGIHLLIGTQRPSVDVLTGLIKANIPARISFKVAEQVDSRTILGNVGAEKLLGRGDMLFQPTGAPKIRVQGAYVDGDEISRVVDYIIENNGEADYDPDIMAQIDEEAKAMSHAKKRGGDAEDLGGEREKKKDPLFYNAVEIAVTNQSIATSSLQRYLEIGYGRAAKLIDVMEKMGIVGPPNGSKPRDVLMSMEQYQVWRLDQRFEDD